MNAILMAALVLQTTVGELRQLVSYLLGQDDGYANIEYVDLMLPSKTLWAQCNLGADKPEDTGDFYAWGELSSKDVFTSANYEPAYRDMLPDGATITYPLGPATQLGIEADAAHFQWGAAWELPTAEQINELIDNCRWIYTRQNGVQGYKVYSKDGKNSIFLPCAGAVDGKGENPNYGRSALYWTKDTAPNSSSKGMVMALYIDSDLHTWAIRSPQSGYSIRPVSRSVKARFDLNGDGKVTVADLAELIQKTLPPPSL